MVTTSLYLDRRTVRADGTSALKVSIVKNRKTAYVPTGVNLLPHQWDAGNRRVVKHALERRLNVLISSIKLRVDTYIIEQEIVGRIASMTARDIKRGYLGEDESERVCRTLEECMEEFAGRKSDSTRGVYMQTLRRLRAYRGDGGRAVRLDDVDVDWLGRFEEFLARTAPSKNARNIHLRNIRAVFNAAIDAEETRNYPFRRFKIRPVATRKRALSLERLRVLMRCEVEEYAEIYRDMFVLIFMLMGINVVDLHRLRGVTDDGRVEFERAKTHRLYSIRVEPEAMAIVERYRGRSGLLCISDRWRDHRSFGKQLNKGIQRIGCSRRGLGGKKQCDGPWAEVTSYWARHTWATVAASLDVPKETIAAALGHGGDTVTDIYIDFDRRKVDEANRRVLDWVLYGRR